jgi:endonuclease/exonuclease/phosphatase family metal-dependent hydrolase
MSNLKVVSYNIHMGLEADLLVKNICDFALQGVAVFCFQEFFKWRMPQDLESLLLKALGPHWQMEYETPSKNSYDNGACILWNESVLSAISFERLLLPQISKSRMWEKAWIRSHGFGANAFLLQKGALVGTFNWNSQRLRITSLHLDWQGGLRQRMTQLTFIGNYLVSHPNVNYEVICGDFNTIGLFNKGKQTRMILEILGNEFRDTATKLEPTFPPFVLDRILVKYLRAEWFQVYKLPGSDHFPIATSLLTE